MTENGTEYAENPTPARNMFGDYEILETVGHGGMGIVYRAVDTSLGRTVALKVLREDLRRQTHLVARFQREAEAFATLNHENIVHIYSVGKVGRIPYIAMEYIDGTPLSKLMKRERRIACEQALDYGEQVARALASAHDAHIIHRDIKPGNILIDKAGHAYVTDFGIAKVLTAETQLTVDGSRLGTPQYMSPERCLNREVTASSDIYSLGVVLFQMISGRLPHEGPTPVRLVEHIISQPPARLRSYVPEIPENVERLIAYMTERKPSDRPQDAHQLVEAMARVRSGKPLHEGDDRSEALAALRGEFATPAPRGTGHDAESGVRLKLGAQRAAGIWKAAPAWLRRAVAACLIAAIALALSSAIVNRWTEGMAFSVLREASRTTPQWEQSGAVAEFVDDSPGVTIAQFNLPGFRLQQAVWDASGEAVALQFAAASPGARSPAALLCIAEPGRQRAAVAASVVTAAPGDHQAALSLIGNSGASGAPHVLFLARTAALGRPGAVSTRVFGAPWRPAGAEPGFVLDLGAPQAGFPDGSPDMTVGAVAAASADGTVLAVAMASYGDQWQVYEAPLLAADDGAPWRPLTGWGGAVEALHYSPGGQRLAIQRRSASGRSELIIVQRASGAEHVIDEGDLSLSSACFAPDGQRLVYAKRADGGESNLWLAAASGTAAATPLGPGTAGAWLHTGRHLVATAEDHAGRNQLWRVNVDEPEARLQLTFLDTGTGGESYVSPLGKWALTSKAEGFRPAVVLVDLERLAALASRRTAGRQPAADASEQAAEEIEDR